MFIYSNDAAAKAHLTASLAAPRDLEPVEQMRLDVHGCSARGAGCL